MHINKIIKTYFLFVMTIAVVGGVSQSGVTTTKLLSVLHILEKPTEEFKFSVTTFLPQNVKDEIRFNLPDVVASSKKSDEISFMIQNEPGSAFATAGTKNKKVMEFSIASDEGEVTLKNLKLKLSGVHPLAVERAFLVYGKTAIAQAKKDNDYLVFSNVDFTVKKGDKDSVSLYVDLSSGLTSGERLRADIESKEDIFLTLGGKPYTLDREFPIKGKYLSIIKHRPWYGVVMVKKDELKVPVQEGLVNGL